MGEGVSHQRLLRMEGRVTSISQGRKKAPLKLKEWGYLLSTNHPYFHCTAWLTQWPAKWIGWQPDQEVLGSNPCTGSSDFFFHPGRNSMVFQPWTMVFRIKESIMDIVVNMKWKHRLTDIRSSIVFTEAHLSWRRSTTTTKPRSASCSLKIRLQS